MAHSVTRYWGPRGALATEKKEYVEKSIYIAPRVKWVRTLYGAFDSVRLSAGRLNPVSGIRALRCLFGLRVHIQVFTTMSRHPQDCEKLSAEECDSVSRILMDWASFPYFGKPEHLPAALAIAEAGLGKPQPEGSRTLASLRWTVAALGPDQEAYNSALAYLERVENAFGISAETLKRLREARIRAKE